MTIQTVDVTPAAVALATYTSAADSAVTFMSLCNHGGATVNCSIHIVPNGDSASNLNLVATDLDILAGDTYFLYAAGEKILLEAGDRIMVVTDITTVSAFTSFVAI